MNLGDYGDGEDLWDAGIVDARDVVDLVDTDFVRTDMNERPDLPITKEAPQSENDPSSPEIFYAFEDSPRKTSNDSTEPVQFSLPSQTPLMPLGMLGNSGALFSRQILGSSEFDLFSQE